MAFGQIRCFPCKYFVGSKVIAITVDLDSTRVRGSICVLDVLSINVGPVRFLSGEAYKVAS